MTQGQTEKNLAALLCQITCAMRQASFQPSLDPMSGIVSGRKDTSTNDLPGGRPEEDIKTATGHSLGHVEYEKNMDSSS